MTTKRINDYLHRFKFISTISEPEFPYSVKFRHAGILIILISCCLLYIMGPQMKKIQYRKFTTGFSYEMAKHFLYFYYYTGYFPLATLDSLTSDDYSKKAAYEKINQRGFNLIMEYRHWSRLGENARIFAFLPDAFIHGPQKPSLKLFNSIVFTLSLLIFFIAFWRLGYGWFALITVLVVLLTPFYQYSVFREKNIFGLMGSVFFMMAGLNAGFLNSGKTSGYLFLFPLLSGMLIAFFTEIRGEIIVLVFSLLVLYLFAPEIKNFSKVLMIILLLSSFYFTRDGIRIFFNKKFDKTFELVKSRGGHPFTGKRASAHSFWHPVFCGLGDFDTKYGYQWNDTVAYHYALPLLRKKTGIDYHYSGKYHLDAYYDKDSLYYVKFEEIPEYESIVKEKVFRDIRNDPYWYAGILFRRLIRILTNTLPFSLCGWLIFPVLFILFRKKENLLLLVLMISLPLSLTPLLIYSGGNSTFNSIFPIIALAILLSFLTKKVILRLKSLSNE